MTISLPHFWGEEIVARYWEENAVEAVLVVDSYYWYASDGSFSFC